VTPLPSSPLGTSSKSPELGSVIWLSDQPGSLLDMKGKMKKQSYGRITHTQMFLFQFYTTSQSVVVLINATFVVLILIPVVVVVEHAALMPNVGQIE
jgi:hypothetical protein